MRALLSFAALVCLVLPCRGAEAPAAPMTRMTLEGFKSLLNGRDTSGWHWSRTVHHGSSATATIEDGAIALRQQPYGQGGLFMTDRRYRDFELYLETDIQQGLNSGIFLRSSEGGSAYQVEMTGGASTANLISENMPLSVGAQATRFAEVWKTTGWNSIRVRVVGEAPQMTLWLNDVLMWDIKQTRNDKLAGETDGFIGLQLHWTAPTSPAGGNSQAGTRPGTALRFRNLYIKEL